MKLRELLNIMQQTAIKIGTTTPMICGGTPRDKYMKRLENISDIDITTGDKTIDYLSQEIELELRKQYNVTRKSMSDGHSTIFIGNIKIDFSSNYNVPNIESFLLEKNIKNPTSMQKEMYSRDFTCNTLLMSSDLKNILDPIKSGFDDINNKIIKTCLDPNITLTSNRNRVVRAIYLACKLDFDLDEKIIEFVSKYPETIKVSTEKSLAEKLNEAFDKDADKASYLLTKMNLWKFIPVSKKIYPYYIKNNGGSND